jgi:hypothetical protein
MVRVSVPHGELGRFITPHDDHVVLLRLAEQLRDGIKLRAVAGGGWRVASGEWRDGAARTERGWEGGGEPQRRWERCSCVAPSSSSSLNG